MSREDAVVQARRWLEEQLVALAGLRNAQPRDPSFRNWRQNTLTVLQRIWPNEPAHSEQFRRIPFTMPGTRTNPRAMREWYSRGCTEAARVLRVLLEEVDTVGVPDTSGAPAAAELEHRAEDDFPTVELPSSDAPRAALPDVDDENMIDLGGPKLPAGAATASTLDRQPDEPSPPSLMMARPELRVKPAAASPPAVPRPAAAAPAPTPAAPPATNAKRRGAPKPAKPAKRERGRGSSREKLKDMLGLARFESHEGSAAPTSAPPAADTTPPVTGSVEATPPKPRSGPPVDLAGMIAPEFRDAPAVEPRRARATPIDKPAPSVAPPPAESSAPPAASTPETAAHDDGEPEIDPEAFARATEDFLRTSPVLGSTGRPVQRVSDATSFLDPDAVAVATLAREIGKLAVPEPQRASLRAHLTDLARRIETDTLDWDALRESVTVAMEHPELARRLMPILLPWLDRAA